MDGKEIEELLGQHGDTIVALSDSLSSIAAQAHVLQAFAMAIIATHPQPGLLGQHLALAREAALARSLPSNVDEVYLARQERTFDQLEALVGEAVRKRTHGR